jgi:serine/threonine-protein kinase
MSQPSWIGQTLNGRYLIEALLGQGGMSAVYRANDPNLKRTVAVKLIHSHLSTDKEFIKRFEEEAAAIASLRHPHIVQVFDFNSDADVHYMVLEFVPGETLFDRLQRLSAAGSKLPIDEAIQFCLNICDALAYAHQRGMIHRDIKPANIMLNLDGQAILMDFGIVKIVGGASHTATGSVLGTARYISPEVIRSEPADQRSDIYSLGITFYEMLSGRTPFQSDSTLTLLMMHLNDPVPDPRSLRDDLPPALVNILLKSLEKNRSQRYQSATEMAADLKTAFKTSHEDTFAVPALRAETTSAGSRLSAQPPVQSAPQTSAKPVSKNGSWTWLLGLGAGLLFVLLALAAVGVFWMARQNTARQNLPVEPVPPAAVTVSATPAPAPSQKPRKTTTPGQKPPPQADLTATQTNFYVRIISITRRGSQYEVQYETTGFIERLPWMHIHFFFNTVAPEEAGRPGKGPWVIYGGPRPFSEYGINQAPEGATQMCALVAHANLTIIPGSGNCVDLPKE